MKIFNYLTTFILGTYLLGCTLFKAAPEQAVQREGSARKLALKKKRAAPKTTTIGIERLLTSKNASKSSLEMLWEIPSHPVDGYKIRYGFAPNQLDSEITIEVPQLEKFDDPVHGLTYRYFLHGIDPARPLFLTIAAFKGDEESPPSRVYSIPAE